MGRKWQMNRSHTINDSTDSIDRVVYHKNNRQKHSTERPPPPPPPPVIKNGGVTKRQSLERKDSSDSSSNSEFAAITINFTPSAKDSEPLDNADKSKTMPAEKTEGLSLADEIVNNSNLPWQDNLDPSPTHLADSIPNNEPVIAHVPSWVNNLSYSHITETGSPYVSPQTTIIPQKTDYHKTVYSLFSEAFNTEIENNNTDNNTDANVQTVTSSEYFPPPWGESVSDDCPQLSPMTMESAIRSEELLQSSHNERAPDHHHVIVPTTHHLFDSASNSSTKHGNGGHLTEVASAPDFQHWRPISKGSFLDNSMRLQSDTMLTEMAFQEGVKTRVQEWLKLANSEEENDADEEDEDGNSSDISSSAHASSDDDDNGDGLDSVDEIERELDIAMSLDKKHL